MTITPWTLVFLADTRLPGVYALIGLYVWEWLTSLKFDLEFVIGKKKFKWPLIFYHLCRYLPIVYLAVLLTVLYSMNPTGFTPGLTGLLNCRTLYMLLHFTSHGCVALASLNLALRTMALWPSNRLVKIVIISLMLGNWVFIGVAYYRSFESYWRRPSSATIPCLGWEASPDGTIGILAYSLCFDLLVLALALYKIVGIHRVSLPQRSHGRVTYTLFAQGIGYFVVCSVLDLGSIIAYGYSRRYFPDSLVTVSTEAQLSAYYSSATWCLYCGLITQVVSPLAACRMVRGLSAAASGDETQANSSSATIANRKNRRSIRFRHTITEDWLRS
ncbi:hypothetical protein CPB83DRAFT_596187 [Crepidotus variabilis]|uniref:Uncharacterized protein n=1 Tax=Crepidotus variabilis TaxID=179855 RepID=A0A9P6E9I5_9AGAR|nr:hypothetical protein CPB83DRAFT_596187 [Crepidotus variabilis]